MKRLYPSRNGKPTFLHVFASALVLLMPLAGWFAAAGCGSDSGSGSEGSKTRTVKLSGEADFRSLQQCIDEAANGDTCLVYAGIYPGTVRFNGKAILVKSVDGPEQTTLDGDFLKQDGQGQDGQGDDTVVRFMDNEGAGAILDGFTVRNGAAADHGGGIYIEAASPTIRNCILQGNSAAGDGGGVYCFGSTARPLIRNTVIEANTAQGEGGALCALYASPDLINCLLFGNEAERGGAVSAREGAAVTLENCTVADNKADEDGDGLGGGLYLLHSTATVLNSILWANEARAGSQAYLEPPAAEEATRLYLRYSDLQGGRAAVVGGENDCNASPTPPLCLGIKDNDESPLPADPLFPHCFPGKEDPKLGYCYYLSQEGDPSTWSPCVDAGDPDQLIEELGIEERTTRTDQVVDEVGVVVNEFGEEEEYFIDLGYHYAVVEQEPSP